MLKTTPNLIETLRNDAKTILNAYPDIAGFVPIVNDMYEAAEQLESLGRELFASTARIFLLKQQVMEECALRKQLERVIAHSKSKCGADRPIEPWNDAEYTVSVLLRNESKLLREENKELKRDNAAMSKEWQDMRAELKTLRDQKIKLERERATAINELCLACGKYRFSHKGACDGCRWHAKEASDGK